MTSNLTGTPVALLHNYVHNHVVHERVVFVTVVTEEVATVPPSDRVAIEEVGEGFWRVEGHYGFMEEPDVPLCLAGAIDGYVPEETTFFLGRETVVPTARPAWRSGEKSSSHICPEMRNRRRRCSVCPRSTLSSSGRR